MIPFRWAAVHLINSICLIQHAVEERKDKRITMIVGEFVWDAEKTMEILYLNSKSTEQEFSVFSQTIYYIYSVKLPTPKIRTHSTKSVPVAIVTKAKKLSREFITPQLTSPTSIGCKSTHDYMPTWHFTSTVWRAIKHLWQRTASRRHDIATVIREAT